MQSVAEDTFVEEEANPFATKAIGLKRRDQIVSILLRLGTYFILSCAAYIFLDIIVKGAPVVFQAEAPFINTDFFTQSPETLMTFETASGDEYKMNFSEYTEFKTRNPAIDIVDEHSHAYSGGGIFGPLIGTVLLTGICIVIALFVGLTTAIFLNEYSSKGKFMDLIRLAIMNLAGVPSIVYGLFGLGLFCLVAPVVTDVPAPRAILTVPLLFTDSVLSFEGWGTCMLAGGCTLAVMILPVIIAACEESLKAIPMGFREASMALGATKWQSISKSVLPYAFPGMLTASILGITRVAGETAPIMFTAALAHKDKLPWQDIPTDAEANALSQSAEWVGGFFSQSVQAMPYHIYTVAARIPQSEYTKPMQYGSVFVFMVVVLIFAALSIYLRAHFRKKVQW
ncbi:phosphate ABC transporter permease PstA [Verrucomicrobiales bacterium]|jgi:phosphate transport system permease protein|nr:phosphate ABC transporter permease PstA [Verrucomicrobiales bacterium]